MAEPAGQHPGDPGNGPARTAWVAGSVGPQLRIAAKSARMLLERHLSHAGASFGTWTVLATLESRGPLIQRDLAAALGIEAPTLTRHLDRLEGLGLIRRNRTGMDRRYAMAELTTAGQDLCHELDAIARTANDRLLAGLSEEQIAQLIGMLRKLTANAAAAASPVSHRTPEAPDRPPAGP